jgi:hypothetical protein
MISAEAYPTRSYIRYALNVGEVPGPLHVFLGIYYPCPEGDPRPPG